MTEILAEYRKLIEQNLCPNCKMNMEKHSKLKRKVCERLFRKKINLPIPTFELDGKTYEVITGVKNIEECDKSIKQ